MLLRLFDVFNVGGGLLHVSCLHWGALGTRSICYIPEYTSGYAVAAHNRGVKREGRFDQAAGSTALLADPATMQNATLVATSSVLAMEFWEG